jgi:hypothetical protein
MSKIGKTSMAMANQKLEATLQNPKNSINSIQQWQSQWQSHEEISGVSLSINIIVKCLSVNLI